MIDFNDNNRAIYLQIADDIADRVLLGELHADERIPSVREYAASVMVNVNTVMRAYDYLSSLGIIYNKRGLGFFVAPDADSKVSQKRLDEYIEGGGFERIFKQMHMLSIPPEYLAAMYKEYIKNHPKK